MSKTKKGMTMTKPKGNPETDPAALAYWWMEVYKPEGGRTSYAKYREMDSAFWRLFTYVSKGSGYDSRSNQQWARILLPKDADIDAALSELLLFLPYIRVTEGYKHIAIFEHTLSAHGMFELREYSGVDIWLVKYVYGRESIVEQFASWPAALDYVRCNHWYGDS